KSGPPAKNRSGWCRKILPPSLAPFAGSPARNSKRQASSNSRTGRPPKTISRPEDMHTFHLPTPVFVRMKLIATLLLSITCLTSTMSQPYPTPRPIRVIQLRGTGFERGQQHGEQLRQEIAEVMGRWRTELEQIFEQPAPDFIADFLKTTQYAEAIQAYTPDLWEEVRGIAEGSGQPFEDVLAFQLLDEYWILADSLHFAAEKHHCSSLGVPARDGSPTHLAQNMDLNNWMDGFQVVMRIRQHDKVPGQLILTCAGLIGLTGMNHRGVGVCVNTLMPLRADTDGLPVAFMVRGLLACDSPEDALSFIQQTPHASGQNYILGL